jgi:hypothetical protein
LEVSASETELRVLFVERGAVVSDGVSSEVDEIMVLIKMIHITWHEWAIS